MERWRHYGHSCESELKQLVVASHAGTGGRLTSVGLPFSLADVVHTGYYSLRGQGNGLKSAGVSSGEGRRSLFHFSLSINCLPMKWV